MNANTTDTTTIRIIAIRGIIRIIAIRGIRSISITAIRGIRSKRSGGFALIELLVSLSIFVIISGALVISFPTFSSQLVLNNLAHEVALTVREAQVFGIGTRSFGEDAQAQFPAHGVYFDIRTDVGTPQQFILFADVPTEDVDGDGEREGNGFYDGTSERVNTFSLRRNNRIAALYACGTSCSRVDQLDITYERPNPEAVIKADRQSDLYNSAQIVIEAPDGEQRFIEVWANGQISVE